jgi:hypothetical protein
MKWTVTVMDMVAFLLVVGGLRLVFRQNRANAQWATRSALVASGGCPPEYEATGKWALMERGEQAVIEQRYQADHLNALVNGHQWGAWVALIGAFVALAAGVLPLWWG